MAFFTDTQNTCTPSTCINLPGNPRTNGVYVFDRSGPPRKPTLADPFGDTDYVEEIDDLGVESTGKRSKVSLSEVSRGNTVRLTIIQLNSHFFPCSVRHSVCLSFHSLQLSCACLEVERVYFSKLCDLVIRLKPKPKQTQIFVLALLILHC